MVEEIPATPEITIVTPQVLEKKTQVTYHETGINIEIPISVLQKTKLFVATPMYGGQCLFSGSLVETEDGAKTIKNIVDSKYNGKVLSLNEDGKFVWNKILGHHSKRNGKYKDLTSKKTWVKLKIGEGKTSGGRSELICTEDHRCAIFDNPLDPKIYYTEAKNLKGKYSIRNPIYKTPIYQNKLYNKEQLSFLIGTLLGDSSIGKEGSWGCSHGYKQKKYIEFKQLLFGGSLSLASYKGSFSKEDGYSLSGGTNAQTKYLRQLLYPDDIKTPKNILQYLDERGLAFWYMDDGYIVNPENCPGNKENYSFNPYVTICTDGFTKEDNQLLCNHLKDKWEIKASVIKYKKYYRIAISVEGSKKFWKIISPFICKSMEYKFPTNFKFPEKNEFNNKKLEYSASLIKQVKNLGQHCGKLYDIEVENTHNFIAHNTVVHNCSGMFAKSAADLSSICTKHQIPLQFYYLFNESLITRARNYCADEFMRSGATHLMFIDSDIGFNPQDVLALLGLQSEDSEYDVIASPYPKKCIAWEKILLAVNKGVADQNPKALDQFVGDYVFNPVPGTKEIQINRPVEVLETGTGFMMIRRKTMEKIVKNRPDLLYKPDHVRTAEFDGSREITMFFQADIDLQRLESEYKRLFEAVKVASESGNTDDVIKFTTEALALVPQGSKRYLSEDYWFCQMVRSLGLKVWLCPWMQLQHVGSFVFGGSLAALASIGAAATADSNIVKNK